MKPKAEAIVEAKGTGTEAVTLVEPRKDGSNSQRWTSIAEAARIVHMSVKTLRLDVNAGLLPVRRADHGRGVEVDLDAAIDKYAGGAPLVSRMFIAFQDGRTPVEMVVESGLDPILVKRLFDAYVELSRDPNVAAMKKTCPECHRTEAERTGIAKEFAHACESPGVERVSCCMRCHVPLAWAEVERDEP